MNLQASASAVLSNASSDRSPRQFGEWEPPARQWSGRLPSEGQLTWSLEGASLVVPGRMVDLVRPGGID